MPSEAIVSGQIASEPIRFQDAPRVTGMILTQLHLSERTGAHRSDEPLRCGIPLPQGSHHTSDRLKLSTLDGKPVPSHFTATAHWPDGSIKWVLADFVTSLASNESTVLNLVENADLTESTNPVEIQGDDEEIRITTGEHRFSIDKRSFRLRYFAMHGERFVLKNEHFLELVAIDGKKIGNRIDTIESGGLENSVRPTLILGGTFDTLDHENKVALPCRFHCELAFVSGHGHVAINLRIHNPNRAFHDGGIWDLGDKGSAFIKGFSLNSKQFSENSGYLFRLNNEQKWQKVSDNSLSIYQESSGGKNWLSNTHLDQHARIPHQIQGYICKNGSNSEQHGSRATPSVLIHSGDSRCGMYMENFWQNFPSAIKIDQDLCRLELFASDYPSPMELQGGEAKTYTVLADFDAGDNALRGARGGVQVTLPNEHYAKTGVLPFFSVASEPDPVQKIINQGLEGNSNYFLKREMIDEYGWRHFGELYADHEAIGHKGDQAFISHYNNQYDSIYGFFRMYTKTGDFRWFELFDDLARHVADIDVYQTEEDRDEYNGGLFWHTDHYLQAFTCTHRTYSKYQKDGQVEGGGPGSEHCYTSGLLYHYLMTGSTISKTAVLTIRSWIERINEGSGTLIETLLDIKSSDIPKCKAALKHRYFNPFKYPLTRGTGNYISTILDSYQLSPAPEELQKIEAIIRNTLHPEEDVSLRGLDDVENAWSYVILLQAIVKYLLVKQKSKLYDDEFYYARDCLMNYARWMLENEYPYLEKPEILDYPNHTWTAQDFRKSYVLFAASSYEQDATRKQAMISRAREFHDYTVKVLSSSNESQCSRHLAIMMQNEGPFTYYGHSAPDLDDAALLKVKHPGFQLPGAVSIFTGSLLKIIGALRKLSIMNELRWLSYRSQRVAKMLEQKRLKAKRI